MTPEELQFYFLFSADKPCYAGGHKGTRRRGKTRSPYDTAFISIGRTGYPSKPIHICQFSSTRSPQIFLCEPITSSPFSLSIALITRTNT